MPEFPMNFQGSGPAPGSYRLNQGFATEYAPPGIHPESSYISDPNAPELGHKLTEIDGKPVNQIPAQRGRNYSFNHGECPGLDVLFHSHNGWIRAAVNVTFTDAKSLEPLAAARTVALESARRAFEALKSDYSKGAEAQKVQDCKQKVEQLQAQALKHTFNRAAAGRKLEESWETDSPYAQWEQAFNESTSRIKANAHLLKIYKKKLEEAEKAFQENWVKLRDDWLSQQTQAHMKTEASMEEEMVRELALKAAALETQQALSREYSGSYYTHSQAPELPAVPVAGQTP